MMYRVSRSRRHSYVRAEAYPYNLCIGKVIDCGRLIFVYLYLTEINEFIKQSVYLLLNRVQLMTISDQIQLREKAHKTHNKLTTELSRSTGLSTQRK